MPGPVSDSYHPEFSTGERATRVREAIMKVRDRLTSILGDRLLNIVDVVDGNFKSARSRKYMHLSFTEQELRTIRFALNRTIDSI
ncbi:hypothetical protein M0R72_01235 [Candidatus Pacearchaeota archaeon]|jgi:hypothetical protein|nr:hypothetical protein [Candidatus Pacearchaeota archaeon]